MEEETLQLRRRARFLGVSAHQQDNTRNNSNAEIAHARPVIVLIKSFGNENNIDNNNAQGRRGLGAVEVSPHKKRLRLFFPEQCSCSGKRPAKQGLSLSKQIAMGLCSCHREKAVKGACTVTQAARD